MATWEFSVRQRMQRTAIQLAMLACCLGMLGCDRFVSAATHQKRAAEYVAAGKQNLAMVELRSAVQKEPNDPNARLELAKLYWWSGDLESAEKELDRATSLHADPKQTSELRYQLMLDRGNSAELIKQLNEDKELAPERRAVLEARMGLREGDLVRARAAVDRALAVAPTDPDVLLEEARVALNEGNRELALKLPERVRQSPIVHARALLLRGATQLNAGAYDEARASLVEAQQAGKVLRGPEQLSIAVARTEAELALQDAKAAEASVKEVSRWVGNAAVTHYLRARIAVLKGDFQGAAAESQKALVVDPSHVPSQLLLASAHMSLGAFEQARSVLTSLLARHPETLAARKLLARLYLVRNQPQEAQQTLAAAGMSDADADWLMGTAMLRTGKVAAGLEHLERSAAADPSDHSRRVDLARAYIAARQPERALEVLASVPGDVPAAAPAKLLMVLATASGKPAADAKKEIQQLAANHPKDAGLLSAAGAVLSNLGDGAAGRALLDRALAADPDRIETHLMLAQMDASEQRFSDAQRRFTQVLAIDAKHVGARLGLAELAWRKGDREATRKWLEEAIAADPATVEARLRLAQIAFIEGEDKQARSLLEQSLQVAKDRPGALRAVGQVLARAGFTDEATARLREASAAGSREAYLDLARIYLDMNDVAQARQVAQSALAARPDWGPAEQLLVMVDAREGQVERAFERAQKLMKNPKPADLALVKGELYVIARQFSAAADAYETAQRQQPTAQTAIRLFQARREAKIEQPERSLTQWLARVPEDANVRRVLAQYYEQIGQPRQAIAEYERLVAGGFEDPIVLNNLAWFLHQKDDPRAIELARKAYEIAPSSAEIGDTYGWILVRKGKVSEGLAVLEKALAKSPDNPDIRYHAAVAYAKSNQPARARELLDGALQSAKPFASRSEAEQFSRTLAAH